MQFICNLFEGKIYPFSFEGVQSRHGKYISDGVLLL